jgi:putative N6-adenine-specific DNA methylase
VTAERHDLFAVASPGLERVAAAELRGLGYADAQEVAGGATFRGTLADAFRANLWLRSASRVLVRLGSFDAPGKRELVARARRMGLGPFLRPGLRVHVGASSQQSRLYHTGLIADAVREALSLAVADKDEPAPTLYARLVKDRCTISLDTSGELLHRRGYRKDVSRAPLRETLAAGILMLCGYDGSQPFVDPMCGSGTFAIEAALIAAGRAPNANRAMAMEACPGVESASLAAIREEARRASRPVASLVAGYDVHGGALHASRTNAARAGMSELVRFERADVARLEAPGPSGLLVTNPPYGKRISRDRGGRGDPLGALEEALATRFRAWDRFVLGPGPELRTAISLPVVRAVRLDNGGLPVELVQYRRTTPGTVA